MKSLREQWRTRLWVGAMRVYQAIGWPGVFGVALMSLSGVLTWSAWSDSRSPHQPLAKSRSFEQQRSQASTPSLAAHEAAALRLPPGGDTTRLLNRIERSAVAEGLGWPRAEYRYAPASTDLPASVEVRCALKGTYPQIRRFVGTILRDIPTVAIRELHISRAGSDLPTVDAKLTVGIFIAGDISADSRASASAPISSLGTLR